MLHVHCSSTGEIVILAILANVSCPGSVPAATHMDVVSVDVVRPVDSEDLAQMDTRLIVCGTRYSRLTSINKK